MAHILSPGPQTVTAFSGARATCAASADGAFRCGPVAVVVEGRGGGRPGPGTDTDADLGFPRIRATVAPAPCDVHARTHYRRH
jgi:hypothetical protein